MLKVSFVVFSSASYWNSPSNDVGTGSSIGVLYPITGLMAAGLYMAYVPLVFREIRNFF